MRRLLGPVQLPKGKTPEGHISFPIVYRQSQMDRVEGGTRIRFKEAVMKGASYERSKERWLLRLTFGSFVKTVGFELSEESEIVFLD